jgi:SAM-dependent methyltransferase
MAITAGYEVFEAIAPTWAAHREDIEEVCVPIREWLLRELAPERGDTLLELAAGTGDTGFEAAASAGHLISSDGSPAMVEFTRARGAEVGVENVEYRVIDAERIELESDAVDGVICRFGYMLMNDAAAALAETRRVLRPGGRLVLAVWGAPERNPYFTTAGMSLARRGHIPPPEPPPAPGIFSMASGERTTALLHDAGFEHVRLGEVPVRFRFADIEEYIRMLVDTAGPIALVLRTLEDLGPIREDAQQALEAFRAADGYDVPGVALCAVAS